MAGAMAAEPAVSARARAVAEQAAGAGVPVSSLAANAPDQHKVVRGDTLWSISGRFLKEPWRWPELWGMNRDQIRNPHRIYPGQTLELVRDGGRAHLRVRGANGGDAQVERLSPRVREEKVTDDAAIPAVPVAVIESLMSRQIVLADEIPQGAARIVALPDERVMLGQGDRAYVRGVSPEDRRLVAFRPTRKLVDPDTGEVLGLEADRLGVVDVVAPPQGPDNVAEVRVVFARQEMELGTRLLPEQAEAMARQVPHRPTQEVGGKILAIHGGNQYAGHNQVIVLNRGMQGGIEQGQILGLYRAGGKGLDTVDNQRVVQLPDHRVGLAYVFRTYGRVAYALVTEAGGPVQVGDRFAQP